MQYSVSWFYSSKIVMILFLIHFFRINNLQEKIKWYPFLILFRANFVVNLNAFIINNYFERASWMVDMICDVVL